MNETKTGQLLRAIGLGELVIAAMAECGAIGFQDWFIGLWGIIIATKGASFIVYGQSLVDSSKTNPPQN